MTGHLFVAPAGVRREFSTNNSRPVRAAFALDNGARLVWEDPRGLGILRLLPRAQAVGQMRKLGLEPLSPAFTPAALFRITRGRRSPLKVFLLDQRRIAGLGNIYAAEALWRARLDPRKRAGRLTRREAARLHRAIVDVLREAMAGARRGYRRPSRVRPEEEFQPAVYGREGEPCPRCARPIRRIVQSARSTFFCPRCQRC
jgi:formamidopyrimidine-DNA glycosylase